MAVIIGSFVWRATIVACSMLMEGKTKVLSLIQAAGWPIWPLIACSVLALALIVERFVSLRTARVAPPQLLHEAMAVSTGRLPTPEVVQQLADSSVLGHVLASGLQALQTSPHCTAEQMRERMQAAGRQAAQMLERYLGALGTIASAAPLLGLLGTVMGMIEIFGSHSAAVGDVMGAGNPAQLAHGISVALYNTAFGLMVAIPALIFWKYFRARVDNLVLTLEISAQEYANHLQSLCKK